MRKSLALAPPLVACAIAAAGLSLLAARAGAATIAAMRDQRRVLIVAAPSAADSQLVAQRRALAGWRQGAVDRDISVVEVAGNSVSGADDSANAIKRRYALPPGRFAVFLIGKDGHVAMRSATPLAAATLEGTIDAMPMRRAGER